MDGNPSTSWPEGTYTLRATLSATGVAAGTTTLNLFCGPRVQTLDATSVGYDVATLNGNLLSKGNLENVDVRFKWGTSASPAGMTQVTSFQTRASTGAFTASITGLSPSNTFHYTVETSAEHCAAAAPATKSFSTTAAPVVVVQTQAAHGIGGATATLNGNLQDLGTESSVTVVFAYGASSSALTSTSSALPRSATGPFSISVSGLNEATTYFFRARTSTGSAEGSILSFATLDATPPSAPGAVSSSAFPAAGWGRATSGTVSWGAATDAGGIKGYRTSLDGQPLEASGQLTTGTSRTLTGVSDGFHTFSVAAVDNADNQGPAQSYSFQVDTSPPTAPTIQSSTHAPGTTCNTATTGTFSWTASTDATSGLASVPYAYRIDSGATTATSSTSATVSGLTDGSRTFTLVVQDAAGNTATSSYAFKMDLLPPTVTVSGPSAAKGPFTVSWVGSDTCSSVTSYVVEVQKGTGGAFSAFASGSTTSQSFSPAGADGTYFFRAKATDALGREGSFPSDPQLSVIYDTTPPAIPSGLTATPSSAGAIDIAWTGATDSGSGIAGYHVLRSAALTGTFAKLTTNPVSAASFRDPGSNTVDGNSYYYRVRAVDAAGNEGPDSTVVSAEADHASLVHTSTQTSAQAIGSLLGVSLTGLLKATDEDGDGRLDSLTDPATLVRLSWVSRIDGRDALLLTTGTARPRAIWIPATNEVLPLASVAGVVQGIVAAGDDTRVTVVVQKTSGWIEASVADPLAGTQLVRVETGAGTPLPADRVRRVDGFVHILDDPEVQYVLVFARTAGSGQESPEASDKAAGGGNIPGASAGWVMVALLCAAAAGTVRFRGDRR